MTGTPFRTFIMAHPRRVEDVFTESHLERLRALGDLVLHEGDTLSDADFEAHVVPADVAMGVFDMPAARLARCTRLKAFVNSEGNFLPNIDYRHCFSHGIRVLSASHVFAEPVAEIGIGMAIDLGRGLTEADRRMRAGTEAYGFAANRDALPLMRARVGLIGFGDLARALLPLLKPFTATIDVYDPWVPDVLVEQASCRPATLDAVLEESDFVFVLAGVTSDNAGFLGKAEFARMKPGACLLLLSRAAVVDFPEMLAAAAAGRIRVATDVFPVEPLPAGDPARRTENILLSPHQAGAMTSTLAAMGAAITADIALIARGLPPAVCKVAQPETATRLRSMPVTRS
ncbi:hydroxyacid dehydrogenase [Ensifer soli]|uniref:hydroxyacid dehydrogenase n=1 Tax=Ciceribacter sp. sgz301302 TaxID=3342379 RepID=UPI0035BA0845